MFANVPIQTPTWEHYWPRLLTLAMLPILLVLYGRLAVTEETEMRKHFGAAFDAYAARTPRFIPSFRNAKAAA